jgi:hypothetical protein
MPKSAYADVIGEWETLLAASRQHVAGAPEFQPYVEAFQQHLQKIKRLKAEQEAANAIRQRRTQQLNEEIQEGQALAMRLRGVVRAKIGPYNELLVQFGMKPVRPRSRRVAPNAGEPPAAAPPDPPDPGERS